jgi:site-specific DNA recombinase
MKAAIYCRLSREDAEKQGEESESIQNQKSLLLRYAAEHGWTVYEVYCDEDYSGADRTRPAFNRMLKDAEAKKFQVLLVKTQSRFTRDMELAEKYLHGLFPEWGIRFIAVVDHADTEIRGNKKARQINALINEWYLEDLSENVRAVLDAKRRAGQYIGGFALYGYQKNPNDKNQLVPDPEAAAVVQHIFARYLAGASLRDITAELNDAGIENPAMHKQSQGTGYRNGRAKADAGKWNRTTVRRILHERMYTGDMVQGRNRKLSYKSKKMVPVPEKEWFIVPNVHEAIISREMFAAVQARLAQQARHRKEKLPAQE